MHDNVRPLRPLDPPRWADGTPARDEYGHAPDPRAIRRAQAPRRAALHDALAREGLHPYIPCEAINVLFEATTLHMERTLDMIGRAIGPDSDDAA